MEDRESSHESNPGSAAAESRAADRRAFMKSAVKTVVAGTAIAGIAATAGKADAACPVSVVAPKAAVKAHLLFNNQVAFKRQDLINLINQIFDGGPCPTCGLGGYPQILQGDPAIIEIRLATAFLPSDQLSTVVFTDAASGL